MKKFLATAVALISLPAFAGEGGSLTVINDTAAPVSVSLNHSCTDFGVVQPHSRREGVLKGVAELCGGEQDCLIQLYNNANCSGKEIAHVGIDTDSGVLNDGAEAADNYAVNVIRYMNLIIIKNQD